MTLLAGLGPKIAVFLVATLMGGSVAYVGSAALGRPGPVSIADDAPDFLLDDKADPAGAVLAAFDMVDAQQGSTALDPLPAADLALAAATLLGSGPVTSLNPLGFPRVPAVTQFDGGPFANANCTLAAGAMLARLGFGIVTTGSILRTLQDDQDGGTGIDDLNTAIFRGYGVSFKTGAITPAQLKNLLSAGYGAVIQGDYSRIPPELRLQPTFTNPHAIYVDGYYPGNGTTPAAYYVIDPIGRGGYDGDWWPASVIDAFGLGFGSGSRIAAAWAFPPGGTPPDVVGPDVLPLPTSGPGPTPTPGPGETPAPGESPSPSVPGPPTLAEPGDITVSIPEFDPPVVEPELGGIDLIPVLTICLFDPKPAGCPTGIPGVFEFPGPILQFPLGPDIDIRFVDSDRPNVVLIGFTVDPGGPVDVRAWQADGSPATVAGPTSMSAITLLGVQMYVARLDLLASTTYHFQVIAGDGIFAGKSPIGTFTTGNGVAAFDVALASVANPVFELGTGFSPYLHLAEGAFVQPYIRADFESSSPGCLRRIVEFGGDPYCLPSAGSFSDVCTQARVSYELAGVEASGVLVRAFPAEFAEMPDGTPTLDGILEAEGPPGEGEVGVGCLVSGLTYTIVLDAVGDARGNLVAEVVTVP